MLIVTCIYFSRHILDLSLVRWTNDNPEYTTAGSAVIDLSGRNIPANGFFLLCKSKKVFEEMYIGTVCDFETQALPVDSNGDDNIAIIKTATGR
jgi:hypothetical protein